MKLSIIYIKPNPGLSEECIAVGLLFILEDGSSMFRWSNEKLSVAIKLAKFNSGENIKGLRSLLKLNLKCIERYTKNGEKNIEDIINHSRIHSNGTITYGDFKPFVLFNNKTVKEVFDMFFDMDILNKSYKNEN